MCRSNCLPARCPGCPATDWNSFTWLWEQPAAVAANVGTTIDRQFAEAHQPMVYPGVCNCLWLVGANDRARDQFGTSNPVDQWFPVASIGALHYRKTGTRYEWQLTITRSLSAFGWELGDARYGLGWGWDDNTLADNCNYAGAGWGGYGGYGWGGYGWGYGYGYGYGWGGYGSYITASYRLDGAFACGGPVNVFNLVPAEGIVANEWPAYVLISRYPGVPADDGDDGGNDGGGGDGGGDGGGGDDDGPVEEPPPPPPPPP